MSFSLTLALAFAIVLGSSSIKTFVLVHFPNATLVLRLNFASARPMGAAAPRLGCEVALIFAPRKGSGDAGTRRIELQDSTGGGVAGGLIFKTLMFFSWWIMACKGLLLKSGFLFGSFGTGSMTRGDGVTAGLG